jgi:hypothetical protein
MRWLWSSAGGGNRPVDARSQSHTHCIKDFLSALARVNVETMILTFLAEFPDERDPLQWLDPTAPGIRHFTKEITHASRPAP